MLPRTPNPTFCAAIRISAEKRLKRSREQDDLAPYVTLLQLRKSRADAVQRKSGRDRYFQVTGGDQPGEFSEDSGVFRFAALRFHAVLLRGGEIDSRVDAGSGPGLEVELVDIVL